jgi:hypothetical protein
MSNPRRPWPRRRGALNGGGRAEQMSPCRANIAQSGLAVLNADGSGGLGGCAPDRLGRLGPKQLEPNRDCHGRAYAQSMLEV